MQRRSCAIPLPLERGSTLAHYLWGSEARGISYVGYDCESDIADELMWNRERFFYYFRGPMRSFIWRVIVDVDDAAWCMGLWQHDENFSAWLEGILV